MERGYGTIGRNILIIDKYMKLYLKYALKPHDLNTAEGMVLLVLYGHDGLGQDEILTELHGQKERGKTQEQLIFSLHYDKGVMTRTMQALESKGYVRRQENSADGRSYIFFLTPKAESFKPTLLSVLRLWSESILQGINKDAVALIESALMQMAENAKRLTGKDG